VNIYLVLTNKEEIEEYKSIYEQAINDIDGCNVLKRKWTWLLEELKNHHVFGIKE